MSGHRAPAPALLLRGRLRLAGLSLLVMGAILYTAGFAMARLLLQEQEAALRRELQTVAGTLHDTLKPSLPPTALPSPALAAALPGLCLVDQPCAAADALIERHAISATDPARFQLRIFSPAARLLAASPGAFGPEWPGPSAAWLEWRFPGGERVLSTTIHLHRAHGRGQQDWGTLQVSRSLAPIDAEAQQLWWLGHGVFVLAMAGMAAASWWLAGLAMAPLLEAYRRQEQFSADVAHELRTPLANLLALIESERSAPGGRTQRADGACLPDRALDRMLCQGQRLQQLIADLLLLASLERPASPSGMQPCDLAEISGDVCEDFSETAAAAGVTLLHNVEGTDIRVLGRAAELSRLLINLLSNALRHTPRGGQVELSVQKLGARVLLTVRDNGEGIARDDQDRIFDRFSRQDASRSRQQGGTGLGLAIAQAIARRHGGLITVQSAPQEGASFRIQLTAAS